MAAPVYVWPMHLLGGVYSDLHGENEFSGPFQIQQAPAAADGTPGEQLTLIFDINSNRSPAGVIRVSATGERCISSFAAQLSVVLQMVENLRTSYAIFPSDYNYIVISEKRALYNATRDAVNSFSSQYDSMVDILKDCQSAFEGFLSVTSEWLGRGHPKAALLECCIVAGMSASLGTYSAEMARDTAHAAALVDMMMLREAAPDEQRRFDLTVPMPMIVDWEGCYYTLRSIYNECITKLNGHVSQIRIVELPGGLFKATVDVTSPPNEFWGPSAPTVVAAKAKLLYTVIKYVNRVLGHPIIDISFPVPVHQEEFMANFDLKMHGIYRSGQRLQGMIHFAKELFGRNAQELSSKITASDINAVVIDAATVLDDKISSLVSKFDALWEVFIASNVDLQTLRADVGVQ